MKYTALELLKLAKVEKAEEKIGKVRVRIAGIRGINTKDHVINIQKNPVEIVVGSEAFEVEVEV